MMQTFSFLHQNLQLFSIFYENKLNIIMFYTVGQAE